ncbi:4-(cytidine 5'-diphospho)-2-C-methyl-D-erythritol kinase [Sphingomonas donggukensis]|uniref:4-diphosphocytidyl-2-C-methyl-D-erythritol kinase n=1 Tax=Sphingomonas donggukensis TaxID=2949093 RepID=A0ABY4TVP4_9SPHN|nr:4-(cytidine 5'-diphospho)-2-C-methyl-D-erythritol kinase [Sphingomonas donggukensis]URW76466.1 4-(cytidine 5'-diphospho)-2-C-methyl-D-erythritol kinase [Sphingomonas donggukensis]
MIVEAAPAKLNLALHVRRRREDGYHDLETLFAFVADGDVLTVALAEAESFTLTGPFAGGLMHEGDNLVLRARRAFAESVASLPPLAVTLDKRLPVASGIGGGSADAAAMLRACARIARTGADEARLTAVASALGADVPACLAGVTAIGDGRGDRLSALDGFAGTPVLLVNPGVAVSTRDVFAAWDGIDRGPLPTGDAATIAREGRNDLAVPAKSVAPVIGEVIDALDQLAGTTLVRMSGSGATCFALFADAATRAAGAHAIGAAYPGWWYLETVLT